MYTSLGISSGFLRLVRHTRNRPTIRKGFIEVEMISRTLF
jgi:hypothetical protein